MKGGKSELSSYLGFVASANRPPFLRVSNRLKAMDCSDDETWYAMKAKVVERPGILTERSK